MYINTKRSTHFPFRTVHGIVVAHDEINTRDVDPVQDSYSFFLPVLEPHSRFADKNYFKKELNCPQNESAVSFWGQFHYTNYLKLELNWNYPQNKNAVLLKVDIKWGLSPKRERGSNRALVLGTI